ncbi:protein FATTY ACID EXPORT 2, chloroplastic [Neltuma alba]|uniref:protein FATTY ACID EXPORT 2, chloroplastic n=1 Tax=Neltuma alba TaxID=207710 RepID=UPI0010A2B1CD|nr:protein FATTY ACID EXPORT 2, chloroplastic-like [Prosopis alba]
MVEEPHSGVGPRTSTASHGHISHLEPPGCGARRLELQSTIPIAGSLRSFSDPSSPLLQALNYLRDRFYPTHLLTQNQYLSASVASPASQPSTAKSADANRSYLYTTGGTGNGLGAQNRARSEGDSNVGRRDHSAGKREPEGDAEMAMLTSQKFTLAYAGLLGVGGVMGYVKGGSQKSLLAGGLSASLLYYVYTELPERPVFASSMGLGISGALLGVMASRFKRTGKVFPAGIVSLVSLVMAGGYLHGIMRSMH